MTKLTSGDAKLEATTHLALLTTAEAGVLVQQWHGLKGRMAALLEAPQANTAWITQLETLVKQMRELCARDTDAALFLLLQTAVHGVGHYSAHHAMFAAVVVDLCGTWLEWTAEENRAVVMAALTMNIGMATVQDALAEQVQAPSAEQRRLVDEHAQRSATLLQEAGVDNVLWLDTVRLHHSAVNSTPDAPALTPPQRLAQLLARVDIFTAKLSRRRSREGASATVAARDACVNTAGQIDAVGATILRVLGLYPPGSCVRLCSGELAVVTRRGPKAHVPLVACLRRADGMGMTHPRLIDTGNPRHRVEQGITASSLRVLFTPESVLAAR